MRFQREKVMLSMERRSWLVGVCSGEFMGEKTRLVFSIISEFLIRSYSNVMMMGLFLF